MAIIKSISSKAPIRGAIKYISNPEKTDEHLMEGINCSSNPESAYNEMIVTKKIYDKTDGRQYKHYCLSYSPEDRITPEKALKNANELVRGTKEFENHEVFLAVHTDKDYVHVHMIVNSVNIENGKKLQTSNKGLEDLKERCNQQCREQGLSIAQKKDDITAWSKDKYKAIEKGVTSDYKSYVLDCYKVVSEVKESAVSKEDFINKMKEKGYETNWTEKRKYITFEDQARKESGEKKYKIRNSNLEKTFKEDFSKEGLEREFKANFERANEREEQFERYRERASESIEIAGGTRSENSRTGISNLDAEFNYQQSEIDNFILERQQREIDRISQDRERDKERERTNTERERKNTERERNSERTRTSKEKGYDRDR